MMNKIKVSIIVTNYNYSKYIKRCLNSCFGQNFNTNLFEIIFIDDNSIDNSLREAKKFVSRKNYKILKNNQNLGVALTSNIAIKKSRGEYFVRVDSDDYISKNLIQILSFYLDKNPKIFGVSCDYVFVGNDKEKYKSQSSKEFPISCGIMYRKKLFVNYGMYNEDFKHREEEELRARLGKNYTVDNLKLNLYRYRKHSSNKTLQKKNMNLFQKKLKGDYCVDYPINYETKDNKKKDLLQRVVAIIPARMSSKRLKNKNILYVKKKPMIYWTINAAKKTKFIKKIFVSSESQKICDIVKNYGVNVIKRPLVLAHSLVYKLDVVKHSVNYLIKNGYKPSLVISLQANSPEIKPDHIIKCIKKLIKFDLNEVISVNKNGVQNAAIRVMKLNTLFQKTLSTKVGFCHCEIKDIHYKKDLKNLKIHDQ